MYRLMADVYEGGDLSLQILADGLSNIGARQTALVFLATIGRLSAVVAREKMEELEQKGEPGE